jgi:uncharacterized membrane protein
MTKREYLNLLHHYLAPLPEAERHELMKDYEAHFTFGTQSGKTEAEIARELGEPLAIARETVGYDYIPLPPQPSARRDPARVVGVSIVMFFLSLFAIMIGAHLWAIFVAVCVLAAGCILSLAALFVEYQIYGGYETYKLYLALGMTGIGMLLAAVIPPMWRGWKAGTIRYVLWTTKTWKGRP